MTPCSGMAGVLSGWRSRAGTAGLTRDRNGLARRSSPARSTIVMSPSGMARQDRQVPPWRSAGLSTVSATAPAAADAEGVSGVVTTLEHGPVWRDGHPVAVRLDGNDRHGSLHSP